MKKIILILALALLFAGSGCVQEQLQGEETIRIGVFLPLTGGTAAYGEQIRNGVDLALSEIEASSRQPKVELMYEDSKCDPKEAISAYNKLVSIDGVKILIGDFCSSAVLAVAPLAEENKVILITPGAAARKISDAGDYIFRNHVTMDQKTGLLGGFASEKFDKVAIIYDNSSEAFVDGMEAFKREYSTSGNELVAIESFKKEDTDFRTQLSKIKSVEPEAIYIGGYSQEIAQVVKQIKELNISSQILTDDTVLDPQFLKIVGEEGEGILFGTTTFDKTMASGFWGKYQDSFGEEPTIFSAQGYDTLKILYAVIESTCPHGNTECVKNELYKVKNYAGVSGKTSFDENGDALKEVIIKTIKNGEFIVHEGGSE